MLLLMMFKQVMFHLSPPYDRHSYRGGLNLGPLQKLLKCSTRKNCKESSWKCIDGKYNCAKCKKGFELKNGRCIRGGGETAITVDLPSVTAQVTLPGFTEATFDEAAQTAFKNAVRTAAAQAVGYSESFITVIIRRFGNTILSSGNRRRQLLGDPAGLDVVFSTTFEGALVANSFAELQALTAQSEQGAITFIATLVNNIATVFPVQTFGDAILVGDPVISSEVVEIEANFPVPAAPAPPTNVQNVGTDLIQWTGRWTAAAESRPLTYSTKCVNAGDPNGCFGTTRGVGQSGLTALTGQVLGLTPGTAYDCFAISVLVGDDLAKCSAAVRYTTDPLRAAGKPTDVTTNTLLSSTTSWYADWTDGTVGILQETYTLKCVAKDAANGCKATAVKETTGILRGTQSGQVDGLPIGFAYDCYVIAVNEADSVCSDKVVYYGSFTTGVFEITTLFPSSEGLEYGQWYKSDMRLDGTAEIVTAGVPAGGPTTALKETTGCDNGDKATVTAGFGTVGLFNGVNFKQFVADLDAIEYQFYKQTTSPVGCTQNAFSAPYLLFTVTGPVSGVEKTTNFVLEPTYHPDINPTIPKDTWLQPFTGSTTGGTTCLTAGGKGISVTGLNSVFGLTQGFWGDYRCSLASWVTLLETNGFSDFVNDSKIVGVSVALGTFNRADTGFVNNVRVASSPYDWTWNFTNIP
jgi:hypothetical protein